MEITWHNYQSVFKSTFLTKAAKLTVRECDESPQGHFVAYVDEGTESYDVSLTFNGNGQVLEQACDCKNGHGFCIHKMALLHFVAQKASLAPSAAKLPAAKLPRKGKSKIPPSMLLLEETDERALRAWVVEILLRNKDLEMAFVHHFSAQSKLYTPKEVEQLTKDAIKAVVKNKRTIDTSELKRIVELWSGIHAPIVRQYQNAVTDKDAFANLHVLIECCLDFKQRTNNNSNKVVRYVEDLLRQCLEPLNNLHTDKAWETATGFFVKHLVENDRNFRLHYFQYLLQLVGISSNERSQALVAAIVAVYRKRKANYIYNDNSFTFQVFKLVQQSQLLGQYYAVFTPIQYSNEYNQALIQGLIGLEQFDLAERYCRQQITGNVRDQYNIGYLQLLKSIYTLQNNQPALLNTLVDLLPFTFDFADYQYVYQHMPEGEAKVTWNSKLMTKAKSAMNNHGSDEVAAFCLQVFQLRNLPNKAIDCIQYESTSYTLILDYFDFMATADQHKTLAALIAKRSYLYWDLDKTERDKMFAQLLAKLLTYFTKSQLRQVVVKEEKKLFYFREDDLLAYIKKAVGH